MVPSSNQDQPRMTITKLPTDMGVYELDTTSQSNPLMMANFEFQPTPEISTAFFFFSTRQTPGLRRKYGVAPHFTSFSNATTSYLPAAVYRFPALTPLAVRFVHPILSQSCSFPAQARQESLAPLYATQLLHSQKKNQRIQQSKSMIHHCSRHLE